MPQIDPGASPPPLVMLTVAATILAPVAGVLVGLVAKTPLQRRQQELEYKAQYLDLIAKSLEVMDKLGADAEERARLRALASRIIASVRPAEETPASSGALRQSLQYFGVDQVGGQLVAPTALRQADVQTLQEVDRETSMDRPVFQSGQAPQRIGQTASLWRRAGSWLLLPAPRSISGWIASYLFYFYGILFMIVGVIAFAMPAPSDAPSPLAVGFVMISFGTGAAWCARRWALHAARTARQRERELF
jgi:hypothetical protein